MSEVQNKRPTDVHTPNTKMFFRKSRKSPFQGKDAPAIDYKDPDLLLQFLSNGGRILPSRVTGTSAKHQRSLKTAIKRARNLALLPFIS